MSGLVVRTHLHWRAREGEFRVWKQPHLNGVQSAKVAMVVVMVLVIVIVVMVKVRAGGGPAL